eukprot:2955536-Pyramimonas_sp.AAC.1
MVVSGGDGGESHQTLVEGEALGRLQRSCQTAFCILPRFNVPGGTVGDLCKRHVRAQAHTNTCAG